MKNEFQVAQDGGCVNNCVALRHYFLLTDSTLSFLFFFFLENIDLT